MWTAKRISADAANKFQIDSGLLLNKFSITAPKEPADQDIVCETTGDFSITCVPQTHNLFEDVNNAMKNAKEGLQLDGWECGLSVEALSITPETLAIALGASATGENGAINPKTTYAVEDFKDLYWIGDMVEANKLLCVQMSNTISTGGLSLTASDNGKGKLALELTPMPSTKDRNKVPMAFYLLTKQDAMAAAMAAETTTKGK